MTGGGPRGRGGKQGIGGDEASLSPFTTALPINGTVVRRDEQGNIRAQGLFLVKGQMVLGEAILTFPPGQPAPDTFLHHLADGVLEWTTIVQGGGGGGGGGQIPWNSVIFTPTTLAGYGITDAFTKLEIQTLFSNITFADTGFGNPIGGIAARSQLPAAIAYDDEANSFGLRQTIPDLEATNFEALMRFIGNSNR